MKPIFFFIPVTYFYFFPCQRCPIFSPHNAQSFLSSLTSPPLAIFIDTPPPILHTVYQLKQYFTNYFLAVLCVVCWSTLCTVTMIHQFPQCSYFRMKESTHTNFVKKNTHTEIIFCWSLKEALFCPCKPQILFLYDLECIMILNLIICYLKNHFIIDQ